MHHFKYFTWHKILLIVFIGNIYEGRKCLLGGTGEIISPSIPNTYNVSNENPSFLVSNGEFFSGNRYSNKSFNNLGGFNNFSNFPGSISASCQNSVINLPLVNNHGNISQINVLGPRIQQLANDIKMDNLSTNNNHIGKSSKSSNIIVSNQRFSNYFYICITIQSYTIDD